MVRGKSGEIVGKSGGARVRCLDQGAKIYAVYTGHAETPWITFKPVRWFVRQCGRIWDHWQRFVKGIILGSQETITVCLGAASRDDVKSWLAGHNGNQNTAFHAMYLFRAALCLIGAEACLKIGLLALARECVES